MMAKPKEQPTSRDYTQTVLDAFVLWPSERRKGFIQALNAADRAAERLHKLYPQLTAEAEKSEPSAPLLDEPAE